jgi:dTDP-4-dehydrorhamnose 3,5-epimerase
VADVTRPSAAFWSGKRVLVLGHTGFRGARLCLRLRRPGAAVSALALPPGRQSLASDAGLETLADGHRADVRELKRGMHFQAAPRLDPMLARRTRGGGFSTRRSTCGATRRPCGAGPARSSRTAIGRRGPFRAAARPDSSRWRDGCEVLYMMGEVYVPELARGVRWNDTAFAIAWPGEPTIMSARDASWPDFDK